MVAVDRKMPFTKLEAEIEYYRSQHKTMGCKITHLFGVPMIALAVPMFFFNFRRALQLFVAGWLLQFIGHYVFEKNRPVIFQEAGNPLVALSALIVVTELWGKVLSGQPLEYELSNNGRHLPKVPKRKTKRRRSPARG
jgi:uncharacterized membrane protein YGL010W